LSFELCPCEHFALQPISAKPKRNSLSRYRPEIWIAEHTKFARKCCLCEASAESTRANQMQSNVYCWFMRSFRDDSWACMERLLLLRLALRVRLMASK